MSPSRFSLIWENLVLFVLFDWALDSEIQLWVGPCCRVQGWRVCNTPSSSPPKREGMGRDLNGNQAQEREGSYTQFYLNIT